MAEKTVSYLPFHAINEFMRDDFRFRIVQSVLHQAKDLPENRRKQLNKLTQKFIQVPGFRNSSVAPAGVRVRPTAAAFEKNPDLVALILSAWVELNPGLAEKTHQLLVERSWEVLPVQADRSVLPGFLPSWPKDEDFEGLNTAFQEKFGSDDTSPDEVSLMVVWLSGRLPFEKEGEETE